jgi:ABC-type bacteriocin/lantibiotic exporter with double-glycine peptidase domain
MLVAFQGLMQSFLQPFSQLVTMGSALQDAKGQMDQIDDVMRNPLDPEVTRPPVAADVGKGRLEGFLELKNISFGYNESAPPLISDFSLSLKPGDRVALVGATGAGKSTIGAIVSGLQKPWSGEVLFDGRPRDQIDHQLLTRSLGRVSQEIFLFAGSVRDNLTLWDETIPESDLIQASRDAQVHDIIRARPGGYDAAVTEDGNNFSGGERQRLEIARALALNPSILVLDEATAALDPATELEIDNNLRRRGVTCVIIAHRLSTIRDCNEIIVLQRGQVVQRGTHDDLIKDPNGLYAALVSTA